MKPTFENLTTENGEPLNIVFTKEELDKWIKEQYKSLTFFQKIRIWVFNILFKNKPIYGKITRTITHREYFEQ